MAHKHEERLNRLRRHTPFICNIRFKCELPEPSVDPKMLVAPLQPEKLARFNITSLERNPKRELTIEPDLGIHVRLLDVEMYSVQDPDARLDPQDAALLQGEGELVTDAPAHRKMRDRLRGAKAELSWLMRTSYISNEAESRRQAGVTDARNDSDKDINIEADDFEAQQTAVESMKHSDAQAAFDLAAQPPVHQSNPNLTAEEVFPVLPDFERWGNNYVLIAFDGDPTLDQDRLAKLDASTRQRLAGEALVKSYALDGKNGKKDSFIAYMVPKEASSSNRNDNDDTGVAREAREGEYEWVQEYQFKVKNDEEQRTYLLRFAEKHCTYVDLNTKLQMKKRTRMAQGEDARQDFNRPSKIVLAKRTATAMEEDAYRRRKSMLSSEESGHQ